MRYFSNQELRIMAVDETEEHFLPYWPIDSNRQEMDRNQIIEFIKVQNRARDLIALPSREGKAITKATRLDDFVGS
jgi:hypothetical protein